VLFSDTDRHVPIGFCSGFLISSTVMITAGHSLINVKAVSVCFDPGPIKYVVTETGIEYYGTYTIYNGDPEYYQGYVPTISSNQKFSTSDLGLIRLYEPVKDVTTFPKLPDVGFADTLPSKTNLQIVGYGFQYHVTPKNNGVMNSWGGTLSQNTARSEMSSANFVGNDKYLKLSANGAQNKGGIVFGDSGGPVIYKDSEGQDLVIAVNTFVSNVNCAGVSYHTRLDSIQLQSWIKSASFAKL
jgi:hypothetical protein